MAYPYDSGLDSDSMACFLNAIAAAQAQRVPLRGTPQAPLARPMRTRRRSERGRRGGTEDVDDGIPDQLEQRSAAELDGDVDRRSFACGSCLRVPTARAPPHIVAVPEDERGSR
jgi:hypothetical protein